MEDGFLMALGGSFLLGLGIGAVAIWVYFSSLLAMKQHLVDSMNGMKGQQAKKEYAEELELCIQQAAVIIGNKEMPWDAKMVEVGKLGVEHPRVAIRLGNDIKKMIEAMRPEGD